MSGSAGVPPAITKKGQAKKGRRDLVQPPPLFCAQEVYFDAVTGLFTPADFAYCSIA